jgi:ribosome-associated protein
MPTTDPYLTITSTVRIPLAELRFQTSRSSGPGGQNVNKLNTRVQMWWDVTTSAALSDEVRKRFLAQNAARLTRAGELQLECQQFRTQLANRRHCLEELTELVRRALVRPKRRKPSRPTRGSRERRLRQKREQSEKKAARRYRPAQD